MRGFEAYSQAREDRHGLAEKVRSRSTLTLLMVLYQRLEGIENPTDQQVDQMLDQLVDQVYDRLTDK